MEKEFDMKLWKSKISHSLKELKNLTINQILNVKVSKTNALNYILRKPAKITIMILNPNIIGKIKDKSLTPFLTKKKQKDKARKQDKKWETIFCQPKNLSVADFLY